MDEYSDADEWRNGVPYRHNTRMTPGKSGETDPDRHCKRPPRKGNMKCSKCFDYNKGVAIGRCQVCGNNNFA